MERRVLWMAVLLLLGTVSLGCGDDGDGGDDDSTKAGTTGGGNAGTTAVNPDAGMVGGEGVVCGSKRCQPPAGVQVEACCFDAFSSTCGMKMGFFGSSSCVQQVETDERCPSVMLGGGGFLLPSCCAAGQCGVMSELILGMPGCIDLATAETTLMSRVPMNMGDEDGGGFFPDGGIPLPDGGTIMVPTGGFMLNFPEPKACQ